MIFLKTCSVWIRRFLGKSVLLSVFFLLLIGKVEAEAPLLNDLVKFRSPGATNYGRLSDQKYRLPFESRAAKESVFEIQSPKEMAHLFIKWETAPGPWRLEFFENGAWRFLANYGEHGFLMEYVQIPNLRHVRLVRETTKPRQLRIYEVEVYGEGDLPSTVQVWKPAERKADILLLVAHPDDEIIFMGGLIPSFAEHSGKQLQVAYMTYGRELRRYELLHALWHCGLERYPSIGDFGDTYTKTLKQAYGFWKEDKALRYVVDLYRKHKPDVVVSHDLQGEYGHGAHRAAADLARKAFTLAADASYVSDYEPWQVKKLYLHLGEDASKVMHMDWKQPLEAFGGKSSLEVAKEAWAFHESQRGGRVDYQGRTFFFQVADGGVFDNAKFSLMESTVGEDVDKNDFFENISKVN